MDKCKSCVHERICREGGINLFHSGGSCHYLPEDQIVRLPYKIGDSLFVIDYGSYITEYSIIGFEVLDKRLFIYLEADDNTENTINADKIGYIAFPTMEEAVAQLNFLKGR